jgi:replicative DNA helicase
MEKQPWSNRSNSFKDALRYLKGRKDGIIKSLQTPWVKVNDAGVDGIEWHTMFVVGGRPGTGKTMFKDQLIREISINNPSEELRVLEFQFEMFGRASVIREFSSVLKMSYKQLCSADKTHGPISESVLQRCLDYAKAQSSLPIDVVEEPCTVKEFKRIIERYMLAHSYKEEIGGMIVTKYINTVVTIDHSNLFKQDSNEKSKTDMLYNLGEIITELKRKYPIIFVVLSQLKRDVETPERNENGKYGNYILETDLLGGDALYQHADLVLGLNRPGMKFIRFYGPEKYVINDDKILVGHFLKCRNGDVRMSFFKSVPEIMSIEEIEAPPCATK